MDEKSSDPSDLTCPKCSTEFSSSENTTRAPRVLICSHSFCTKCVGMMIKEDSGVECPLCRELSPLVVLDQYRINSALIEYMVQVDNRKELSPCNQCEEAPAELWCYSCDAAYCESCSTSLHENKALKKHGPVPLKDRARATCELHVNENLAFYCFTCKKAICNMCTRSVRHEKHKCELVSRVVIAQKQLITDTKLELQNRRSLLEFLSTSSHDAEVELDKNTQIAMQNINEDFDTIIAVLNERRNTLLEEINEKAIDSKARLWNQRFNFADTMTEITALELEVEPIQDRKGVIFIEEVNKWLPEVGKLYQSVNEIDREPAIDPSVRFQLPREDIVEIAENYGSVSLGTPFRSRVSIVACRERKPKSLIIDWKPETRKRDIIQYVLEQKRVLKEKKGAWTGWREVVRTDRTSVKITNLRPNQAYAFRVCALTKEFNELPFNGWSKTEVFSTKGFTFNRALKGKDLVFSKDYISVTYIGNGNWSVIATEQEFKTGVVDFQVRVNTVGTGSSKLLMAIGVVPSTSRDYNTWLGSMPGSMAYAANGYKVGQTSQWDGMKYGDKYDDGDIINCELDFNNKTLKFSKNDVSQGVSHRIVKTPYKFAVAFAGTKGSVTLV